MDRFRIKDERGAAPSVSYYDWIKRSSCSSAATWAPYSTSSSPNWRSGRYSCMDDVVGNGPRPSQGIAGFRFNPMTRSVVEISTGSDGDWEIQSTSSSCSGADLYYPKYKRVSGGLTLGRQLCGFGYAIDENGRPVFAPVVDPRLIHDAWGRCSTKVWSERGRGGSNSNLYESLAEIDKTLGLLSSYLTTARKIATAARRANPKAFVKEASSAYLMTRYGFMPTLSDIFNTLLALDASLGLVLETTRAQEEVVDTSSSSRTTGEAATWTHSGFVSQETKATFRAMSLDRYERTIRDALGLSTKNLVTVPWDLKTMSFVYDWFFNINDFLGSLVPDFGVTQIGGCRTMRLETVYTYVKTASALNSPSSFTVLRAPPQVSCEMISLQYVRLIGLQAPSLYVNADFKFSNMTRALDAATLLAQKLRP